VLFVSFVVKKKNENKRLHLTGTPLRFVFAGEAHVMKQTLPEASPKIRLPGKNGMDFHE